MNANTVNQAPEDSIKNNIDESTRDCDLCYNNFMFDAELFDVEYVVIGKSVAKSVGIVSERAMASFFVALEGHRNLDWFYTSNGVRVEWSNVWDTLDSINYHTFFKVMPIAVVPPTTLSTRQTQYDAITSKPFTRSEIKGKWFEQHARQHSDESELEFEHRIIKTLVAVFRAIKKSNQIKTSP